MTVPHSTKSHDQMINNNIGSLHEFGHNDGYYMKSRSTIKKVMASRNMNCKQSRLDEKERSSPVSPLQFSHLEGISMFHDRTSSYTSLAPSSNASGASDEDSPDNGKAAQLIISGNSSSHSGDFVLPDYLLAHRILKNSLTKMAYVYDGLLTFDSKLTSISFMMLDSECAFASLYARSGTITNLIDIGLAQAAEFVRVYDAEHDVRRAVAAGPEGIDAQSYIHHVDLLEDIINSETRARSLLSLHNLQQIIQTLMRSSLLERVWITRLSRVITALENIEASFHEESCHDLNLLDASFHLLLRLWKTMLTDYGMLTPLHVALPSNPAEKWGRPPPPPPPLSPHLVLTLRDIIKKLASTGKEKACLEAYKGIRSLKANESLQALYPDYLQYSTAEAMEKLDWVELKSNIQLWKQHLMTVTSILLTVEYDLCRQVFSSSLPGSVWRQCFDILAMQAGLEEFLSFAEAVARCSHEHPEKLLSLLDMVGALEDVDTTLKELFAKEVTSDNQAIGKLYDVQQLLVRAISKAFRHFRFQFDMQSNEDVPANGGVLELSICTLTSVCQLLTDPNEHILRQAVLIEQNERGQGGKDFELSHAILHMLNSLERRITEGGACMTTSKGRAFSCLFLMNNYWYMYVMLSGNEKLVTLLGEDCLKVYREKAKEFAHTYQRETWAPILQYLTMEGIQEVVCKDAHDGDDGSKDGVEIPSSTPSKPDEIEQYRGETQVLVQSPNVRKSKSFKMGPLTKNHKGSDKSHGKLKSMRISLSSKEFLNGNDHAVRLALVMQRVRVFQLAFEGVYQRHKGWTISDPELRERIGKAVKRLVVPTYEMYLQSFVALIGQNKAQVQLKYSVNMVDEMISRLFEHELSMDHKKTQIEP